MSTRTATDDSVFHQNRYASSPEFERGLIANLVAKRCEMLDDRADRELIWFVQYLSHQPGGLAAVASELIAKFAARLGTPTMVKNRNEIYQLEEVKAIRRELPKPFRKDFPLAGDSKCFLSDNEEFEGISGYAFLYGDARLEYIEQLRKKESAYPSYYSAVALLELCRHVAVNGEVETSNLEKELFRLCLDPSWNLTGAVPWYFADLMNVLRDYRQQWISENSGAYVTALGKKVYATLDYTLHSRSLALLEGNARLGKSHAARVWCLQHPGQARFIEVPPSNDDATFFRALARGIGLGNFLKYKVAEIRERVESVLLTGDLILVLDEAQRLWPQRNLRYGFPSRIVWVMAMANANVPVCMVSTPQFVLTQKAVEKSGWNSAQLTGRIGHYEFLPTELSATDIIAVAQAVLPEASPAVLQVLADYASGSSRYLAAVDSIAKRARYIAQMDGRSDCSAADVRTAMKESVIPSDTRLVSTLESAKKITASARRVSPSAVEQCEIKPTRRETMPIAPDFSRRGETLPDLVQA